MGSAESANEDEPPRIVVMKSSASNKRKAVDDEVYTRFSLRKTNMVSRLGSSWSLDWKYSKDVAYPN